MLHGRPYGGTEINEKKNYVLESVVYHEHSVLLAIKTHLSFGRDIQEFAVEH